MIQSAFFQQITEQEYKRCAAPMESSAYERIQGIDVLGTETFPFGRDGKPFYVSGPNDSPTRIRRILDTLVKCVGEGGFDYLVHVDEFA